jgi:hypothetical protein
MISSQCPYIRHASCQRFPTTSPITQKESLKEAMASCVDSLSNSNLRISISPAKMAPTPPHSRPKLTLLTPNTTFLSPISNPSIHSTTQSSFPSTPTPLALTSVTPPMPVFPSLSHPNPCLQCHLLGLKCSFKDKWHYLPPRVSLHPAHSGSDKNCCVRCCRNGNDFCILQLQIAEPRTEIEEEKEGKYEAEGVSREVVMEKVEELVKEKEREKEKRVRLALPMDSEHHRKILKSVRWKWEGKGNRELEDVEAFKARERALEALLNSETGWDDERMKAIF